MSNDIEQIKERLDIVDVVQEYIPLKKVGSNWKANCPFHNEKTPSFMVSQEKQIWHCFGCDRGGDIFSFVQEMDGVDFGDVLRRLAIRAGVELEYTDPAARNQRTKLLDIVEDAQKFYQLTLQQAPQAEVARKYLKERGMLQDIQEQFGLGYSYDEWDKLNTYLKGRGFSDDDIFSAGLTIKKDPGAGYYDRFRGRLMIPLYDVNGQVVGFTARTLKVDEKAGKYINSPQSDVYDKSTMVYGLNFARQAIKKLDASIIVEGNLDVLSAHQAGFPNVVAASGTALTDRQIALLKRYSENILIAFDVDAAGIKAAQRGIAVALQHNMNIKVIQLPSQFKDPDDCIQHDPQIFKQAIRAAVHIIDFFFESITAALDLKRVEHKKKATQQLLPILQKITDSVEQAHYIQKLADLVQVDQAIIQQKLDNAKTQQKTARKTVTNSTVKPHPDRYNALSHELLALILCIPEQFKYCIDYLEPIYLTDTAMQELYKRMIDYYNNNGFFDELGFLEVSSGDREIFDVLHLLADNIFTESDHQKIQEQLISDIRQVNRGYIQRRLRTLESQLKKAEELGKTVEGDQLFAEFQLLSNKLTEL